MRIIGGYQYTRKNKEDFALTPYLFLVYFMSEFKVFGIGLCWGYGSIYIGLGANIPKNYPSFKVIK